MMIDQILIANERDQRTLAWLIEQVGEHAIVDAVGQLAGKRRPYLSNVAKVLGVDLPAQLERTPTATAREHLAAIKQQLSVKLNPPR